MINAYLIPGFHPERSFSDPDFDVLRENMQQQGVHLEGIKVPWGEYSIEDYGRLACAEIESSSRTDVLIAHSVGAIVALRVVEIISVRHLILCSPSALFAEDVPNVSNQNLIDFIGEERLGELSAISAKEAANNVNAIGIPTTITYGSLEEVANPRLISRALQLTNDITSAELIKVNGADHSIRRGVYATEAARLVAAV